MQMYKDDNVNYHALTDLEGIQIGMMTLEAGKAAQKAVFARYGATERITHTYKNGIVTIGIFDRDGKYITEYTGIPDDVGKMTKNK